MNIPITRKNSPERPADWRWQRAGELIDSGTPVRRDRDNDGIREIQRFRVAAERARTPQHHAALSELYPALYEAWALYTSNSRRTRWELEARLLSGESKESIARKLATSGDVVTAYEQYFFNVYDRLDAPSYIVHHVLKKSVQAGLAERAYDILWKMYGYWSGPATLDAVVFENNCPSRPETAEGVVAGLRDRFAFTTLLKALTTMQTLPVSVQTAEIILTAYMHMLDLEKASAGGSVGGGGVATIMENVRVMMNVIPYEKHRIEAIDVSPIGQLEQHGIGIRACELPLFSEGENIPPAFLPMIASARFPEKEDDKVNAQAQ